MRRFPDGVSAAVEIQSSSIHGQGVFALRPFQAGESVLAIDDSRIVDETRPLRPELEEWDHHCDYLADGRVVLMAAPERHINSSCDPNTYVQTRDEVRYVLARRAIAAGEEITYDYIINCHGGDVWTCVCGSPHCRGEVPSSFFELPDADLIRYLPLLDTWFVDEHTLRIRQLCRRLRAACGDEGR